MLKMDSHIHSEYSPDSNSKIDDILKTARSRNLDIIAISDHNTVDGTADGHILGFGCEENIPRDLSPQDTIDRIHDLGGLAIIPHPYCFYRHGLLCKSDYKDLKIDAIEIKNARFIVGYCNSKAKKLSKKEKIPQLGASDAHYWKFVGDCYSLIDCEKDIESLLKSIVKGKIEEVNCKRKNRGSWKGNFEHIAF